MKKIFFLFSFFILSSCNNETPIKNECQSMMAKAEIESMLKSISNATKVKDIDKFIESCDEKFILESNESEDKDRMITKDSLKADILQSWGIITKMIQVDNWIDSFYLASPDTAIAFTNQFFHRTFSKPNNLPGEDDIISTQRHREIWIKRKGGWKQSCIKELGGFICVNGKVYNPEW